MLGIFYDQINRIGLLLDGSMPDQTFLLCPWSWRSEQETGDFLMICSLG